MNSQNEDNLKKRCNVLLLALLGNTELVDKWWQSKNIAFDLKTPEQQWFVDSEAVYNYLLQYNDYNF